MAVKIHLERKTISLGVGDLIAEPMVAPGRVAGIRTWTRLAMGRDAHAQHQAAQSLLHTGYAKEIFVRYTTTVDDFTVKIHGDTAIVWFARHLAGPRRDHLPGCFRGGGGSAGRVMARGRRCATS